MSGVLPQRLPLRGRYYFLTYPRREFDRELFWNYLQGKGAAGAVLARELHEDGHPHMHAAVDFGRRRSFCDSRTVFGPVLVEGEPPLSGNYQVARSWAAVRAYVEKDTDLSFFGTASPNQDPRPETEPLDIIGNIVGNTYPDYLIWALRNKIPFPYATAFWGEYRGSKPPTLLDGDEIVGTITMPQLLFRHFDRDTTRALVIQGPTGCGKTTWAKRNIPKPALMVSHVDDLKHFVEGYHVGIVFDDMHFAGDERFKGAWPRTSQIHLVDFHNGRSIHCRHRCAYIPPGIFKIFTCNQYPFTIDPAIERRICLVVDDN